MQLGVSLPANEIGADAGALRALAQAIEAMGFRHICVGDHVLGADVASRPGYEADLPVTNRTFYHEPLTLIAFLSSCAPALGFATSILVLPQRQTALVAKQAAEIDVLCGGRLRLGIGIGRYEVEYEALGMDFHTRGRRLEEQVALMRALWTEESVTFHGRWHDVSEAGINPLPVQRPIPIWFGGGSRSETALKRIARLADGWFPGSSGSSELAPGRQRLMDHARAAGRDLSSIPMEVRLNISRGDPDSWREAVRALENAGATHISAATASSGTVDGHVALLRRFKESIEG